MCWSLSYGDLMRSSDSVPGRVPSLAQARGFHVHPAQIRTFGGAGPVVLRCCAELAVGHLGRFRHSRNHARRQSRVSQDGPALMLSTAATAACSLLFWVLAARTYPVG